MNPPTSDLVTSALDRILGSALFARADRQSRFLRHIVDKKLAGDDAALRETVIGLEVYERPSSYDPKTDPIVRVEAARLRGRLREYYETVDEAEPVIIRLPKGAYAPTFEWRIEPKDPAAAPPPAQLPTPQVVEVPQSLPPGRTVAWRIPILLVALLAVIGTTGWWWFHRGLSSKSIDSIAIMPFADLSEKHDLSYLAAGLAEQIEEEFGRIRNVRVIGSTTAKQEAGNADLRAAAHRMGAGALLEGSIRSENRNVRVSVRLYDGETGAVIWSGSFDGDRTNLFSLEEKIAQALAAKLEVQLAARREGIDARVDPRRAQSYDLVEQAKTMMYRESAGPLEQPFSLLQQAVSTDPSYGAAHAALASLIIRSGGSLGGPGGGARALAEIQRALELDPGLPFAHATLIVYYRDIEANWKKAQEVCGRALQDYPNAAPILNACATIEGDLCQHAKELELDRRAVALDPLSGRAHGGLMMGLYRAGQFDEALAEAVTAQRLLPASYFVRRHHALILAARGDFSGALKVMDDAHSELGGVPEDWMTIRGYILGKMGRRADAEQLLADYRKLGANDQNIAVIYLGLGNLSKALDHLELAFAANPSWFAHLVPQYFTRVLDGQPRFEAMRRKLGLDPHSAPVPATRS